MISLHSQILRKNGEAQFAVLPYEEYRELQERMEDLEDLVALLEAKLEDTDEPSIPHDEIARKYGLR